MLKEAGIGGEALFEKLISLAEARKNDRYI